VLYEELLWLRLAENDDQHARNNGVNSQHKNFKLIKANYVVVRSWILQFSWCIRYKSMV